MYVVVGSALRTLRGTYADIDVELNQMLRKEESQPLRPSGSLYFLSLYFFFLSLVQTHSFSLLVWFFFAQLPAWALVMLFCVVWRLSTIGFAGRGNRVYPWRFA